MKKLLSVILSGCMLATSMLALNVAHAEAGDKKLYFYDPEMLQATVTLNKGVNTENVYEDELHGNVFKVSSTESADGTLYATHSLATLDEEITNTKVNISYKMKVDYPEGMDSITTFVYDGGGYLARCGITGPSTFLMNHWNNLGSGVLSEDGVWHQMDIVVDQKAPSVSLYKDGKLYLQSTNATQFEAQGLAGVKDIVSATHVAYSSELGGSSTVTLDNVKVFDAENGDFYVAGGTTYDGAAYLDLSATLASKNIDLSGTVMRKVGTNDTVDVTATVADYQTIKVDFAGAEIETNTEYEVIFPESADIKDMFGRSLTGGAAFFVEGSGVETVVVGTTGFDNAEGDTWKWLGWGNKNAYANAPGWANEDGISAYWSEWGATRSAGISADTDGNSVMLIKDNQNKAASGLLYDLSAIPDVCDLKISYRMKTNFTNSYFVAMFAKARSGTGGTNESFLASVGVSGDGHEGGLSIATGSRWMMDGGYNLLSAEEYVHDVWYTVEAVYHLNGVGTMTADYVIKNADGEVVASVAGKNVASAFVKPAFFGWRLQHGAGNSTDYAMVDDLSISYDIPANNVKTVRLENVEGSELVPTTTPASDMKAINVTFTAEATDVAAILADNSGNEITLTQSGSGSAYSFALETFPKGGTEYTFTLTYDGKTYEYTFTPVAAEDIVISDFNIYKGDVALDSLEGVAVGDELKVSATIINATGKDEEAVVSYALYGDNYLKAVNISAGDVTDLTEGVTLYKIFTITEDLGEVDTIKGFLWDSLKTMKPIVNNAIELK